MSTIYLVDEHLTDAVDAQIPAVSTLDEAKATHRVRMRARGLEKSRDAWKKRALKAEAKVQELMQWAGRMDHELSACLAREEE